MIRSKAEATKIHEQAKVQKDVFSRFNSSLSFDGNDINTLTWIDVLERMINVKANSLEGTNVPVETSTPKALRP